MRKRYHKKRLQIRLCHCSCISAKYILYNFSTENNYKQNTKETFTTIL